MPSYTNNKYSWSQVFKLTNELPQLILRFKDQWDILDNKTKETLNNQRPAVVNPIMVQSPKNVFSAAVTLMDERQFTAYLQKKFDDLSPSEQKIISEVWSKKDDYIRWPKESILLFPGLRRSSGGFHVFSTQILCKVRQKQIKIRKRSNGPAIMAFLFAGGERPRCSDNNHEWTIHHIYDGKFSLDKTKPSIRAVKLRDHFTQSAGLVAIHPIADSLAHKNFYFAWLLRFESYKKFGYDPDNVFSKYQ